MARERVPNDHLITAEHGNKGTNVRADIAGGLTAPIGGQGFGSPWTQVSTRSATCCQPMSSIMAWPRPGKISASVR